MQRSEATEAGSAGALFLHAAFKSGPERPVHDAIGSDPDARSTYGCRGIRCTDLGIRRNADFMLCQHRPFDHAVRADTDHSRADKAAINPSLRAQFNVSISLSAAVNAPAFLDADGASGDNVS